MNKAAWLALAVVALAATALLLVRGGWVGERPPDLGVKQGRLKPPSATPNSVSSQAELYAGAGADYARIAPLAFQGEASAAMARLARVVASMPGATVIEAGPDYLYAEFRSPCWGFVDDVEFFPPPDSGVIQLRSASRLGRRDFGVNRKRIESIRARFTPV